MLGKNHILSAHSVAVIGKLTYDYGVEHQWVSPDVQEFCNAVYLKATGPLVSLGIRNEWIIWIILIALYTFGTLLPDIDSSNSLLGRWFYLPVEHRGATHTMWALGILLLAGVGLPLVIPVAVGYFVHLWMDDLSRSGICWWYPISQYREYNGGGRIKKGFHLWIYRTGKPSEYVFVTLLVVTALLMLYLKYPFLQD